MGKYIFLFILRSYEGMAIPAKRFEFLSKETNVAISDFQTSSNSGTLNTAIATLEDVQKNVKDFLDNSNAKTIDPVATLTKVDSFINTRVVKGLATKIEDITTKTPKEITDKIKALTNDNIIAAALIDKLPQICKDKAISKSPSDNPFGSKSICNGRSRNTDSKCADSSKDFGKGISALTGGTFNYDFTSLDNLYNLLTGLTLGGFNMDMCGVFNSLVSSLNITDTNLLSKASSVVVKELTDLNDTTGLLDMASSSINLDIKSILPDVATNILSGYTLPKETISSELSSLYDRTKGALDIYDGGWFTSSLDTSLKLHPTSDAFKDILTSKVLDNAFNSTDLTLAPSLDEDFLLIALS